MKCLSGISPNPSFNRYKLSQGNRTSSLIAEAGGTNPGEEENLTLRVRVPFPTLLLLICPLGRRSKLLKFQLAGIAGRELCSQFAVQRL